MLLEETIEVRRPRELVFAYLADHGNHAEFIKENETCEQVTPGPMAPGVHLKNTARMLGRPMVEHFEVTRFEPGEVIEKASREGSSFETTDRFELSDRGEHTKIRFVVTGEARHIGERLLFVILAPVLRRSMRSSLARLRDILEARED